MLLRPHATFSFALKERRLHAVRETVTRRLLMIHDNSVDQQIRLVSFRDLPSLIVQTHRVAIHHDATETLTHPQRKLLLQRAVLRQMNRTEQIQSCTDRLALHVLHYVANGVLPHFLAAHGRVRAAYARV